MSMILLITMSLIIMNSCRNRTKAVERLKERSEETIKQNSIIVVEKKDEVIDKKKEIVKIDKKEQSISGTSSIKGATTPDNDFNYYNIIAGDTLQKIHINGSADFTILNNYVKSEVKSEAVKIVDNLNIVGEIARKSVAVETIKTVAKDIKKVETSVKNKGFAFPFYVIFLIGMIAIFIIWFLWRKFGAGITSVLTNARKRFGSSKNDDN